MYVVVVGSRKWQGPAAEKQIHEVMDALYKKYSGLIVVSSSCDQGAGNIIKTRCLKDKNMFQLVEYQVRLFLEAPRAKLAQIHRARNASLAEIGEAFHVFVDEDRRGTFEDLVERVELLGRSEVIHIHLPGKPWEVSNNSLAL